MPPTPAICAHCHTAPAVYTDTTHPGRVGATRVTTCADRGNCERRTRRAAGRSL